MTTPIKTQCPHCQACFNLQKTQLDQADATVCCNHCRQYFSVNEHLIVTTNTAVTSTDNADTKAISNDDAATPANMSDPSSMQSTDSTVDDNEQLNTKIDDKTSTHNQHLEAILDSDTLIHDDMIIEETTEVSLEYDSLDGMEAWLTQTSPTNDQSPASNGQQKNSLKTSNKDAYLIENPPLTTPTAKSDAKINHEAAEKSAMSSAAANDIHASVNSTSDNTWLEQLLKEQNDNENGSQSDTDLAKLLIKMGVPVNDEDKTNQERTSRIQARMQSTKMQTRTSITALLWTMGCAVLALLLFAQYVIFNLDTLIKNPTYAERLQTVCSIAACSLPSADLNTLKITDLNHRISRVSTTSAFSDVRATLSNRSSQAQLLPNLKVSVHSPNALIGEFIAMPDDYLLSPQNQLAAEGRKQLMFTIPVADNQIDHVTINPIY